MKNTKQVLHWIELMDKKKNQLIYLFSFMENPANVDSNVCVYVCVCVVWAAIEGGCVCGSSWNNTIFLRYKEYVIKSD